MKYKHIITSILLLLSLQSYSQEGCVDTVFINTDLRTEGNLLALDINVDDFVDIQSIQFGISYDPEVITFDGSGNYSIPGLTSSSIFSTVEGEVRLVWFDNSGVSAQNLADGSTLVTLYFNELTTGDPDIAIVAFGTFVAEASNSNGELYCINNIGTDNGGGNTGGPQPCVNLDLGLVSAGDDAIFSVKAYQFTDLDLMSFDIDYDETKYSYISVSNFGALTGLSETSVVEDNGVLHVEWVNPALMGLTIANGSTLFDVQFAKIEEGNVAFYINSPASGDAATNDSGEAVCLTGDVINIGGGNGGNPDGCVDSLYVDIIAINGAADLSVDFEVYNFENIVSLQFTVDYDPTHMTYVEQSDVNAALAGIQFFESTPGKIGLTWIDPVVTMGRDIADGESMFTLNFQATSSAQSAVTISDNPVLIEITRANGNDIEELCLSYNETNILSEGALLSGYINHDVDSNCLDDDNTPLSQWIVQFSSTAGEFYSSTDESGYYQALVSPGTYTVSAVAPNDLWVFCINDQVSITANNGDLDEVDFLAQAEYNCPLMYVDVSTPFLRRCFDNTYQLNYCNYGTTPAEDVYIEVALDDDLIFIASDYSDYSLDANTNIITFNIGDMAVNECNKINFEVNVSCESVLGATHCAEAVAYPVGDCSGLGNNGWDGASLRVQGSCDGDSVRFIIKNNGIGDMLMPSEFIVIEDDVMFNSDQINLPAGEIQEVAYEATGVTYRVEVDQVSNHPGSSNPSAFVEGCDADNDDDYSTGFALMFPQDDNDPWVDIDCQENIGSYDPNDKAAFPKGYGNEHYIKKNTDIEYKIRFQNTGTDTAFKVVIIDTLSENVDVSTFRVGTSSHDYKLVLRNQEVKFIFNDIQLVDSFKNEPLSHGFITYKIEQKADLADGNQILNKAGIYFDFNDPIITNTTYHEIGTDFMDIINNTESNTVLLSSQVYPHPMTSQSFIKLDSQLQQEVQLRIIDAHGRTIRLQSQYGNLIPIYRDGLVNGMYYYEVRTDGVLLSSGKLVIQ